MANSSNSLSAGVNTLQRLFTTYPNMYIPCDDCWDKNNAAVTAYAESDAAGNADVLDVMTGHYDALDGNGEQTFDLTLETGNDDVQWGGASPDGFYTAPAGNTAHTAYHFMATATAALFNNVLAFQGNAVLLAHRVRTNAASFTGVPIQMGIGDATKATRQVVQGEMSGAAQPGHRFDNDSGILSRVVIGDAMSNGDDVLFFTYLDARTTGSVQGTMYTPGTKNIIGAPSIERTGFTLESWTPTVAEACLSLNGMLNSSTGPVFQSIAHDLSIRNIRIINFGTNPPTNVSKVMEDLAVNSLLGTSLEL